MVLSRFEPQKAQHRPGLHGGQPLGALGRVLGAVALDPAQLLSIVRKAHGEVDIVLLARREGQRALNRRAWIERHARRAAHLPADAVHPPRQALVVRLEGHVLAPGNQMHQHRRALARGMAAARKAQRARHSAPRSPQTGSETPDARPDPPVCPAPRECSPPVGRSRRSRIRFGWRFASASRRPRATHSGAARSAAGRPCRPPKRRPARIADFLRPKQTSSPVFSRSRSVRAASRRLSRSPKQARWPARRSRA